MTATPYRALALSIARAARLIGRLDDPEERDRFADRLRVTLQKAAESKGLPAPVIPLLLLALESALMVADPEEPEHQPTRTTH